MTREELLARWRTAEGTERREAIRSRMRNGVLRTDWMSLLEGFEGVSEVPHGLDLRGLDLGGACLAEADLAYVYLDHARLDDCLMERAKCWETRLTGASLLRVRAADAAMTQIKAEGACFDGADLRRSKLDSSILSEATFRGAALELTDFAWSDLVGADFTRAAMRQTCLHASKLASAVFRGAALEGAEITWATLENTDMTGATIADVNFDGTNLDGAIGLPPGLKAGQYHHLVSAAKPRYRKGPVSRLVTRLRRTLWSPYHKELDRVRSSPVFEYLLSASNGSNDIHHFAVRDTTFRVLLHEDEETSELFPIWIDAAKRSSREGPYVRLRDIFASMPPAVRDEICRLRPILSRYWQQETGEADELADLVTR